MANFGASDILRVTTKRPNVFLNAAGEYNSVEDLGVLDGVVVNSTH